MIPILRNWYNANYTEDKYLNFLRCINTASYYASDFKISETPLFLCDDFTRKLMEVSENIISQIISKEYDIFSSEVVPDLYKVPGNTGKPVFIQLDFAISKANDHFTPVLVELQGFPSLYCFQSLLAECYKSCFNITSGFSNYFNGLDDDSYYNLLRDVIIGNHETENVILLEIKPESQRTRIDFSLTEKHIGIKPVCISKIRKKRDKLYYNNGNREIHIERIYNRVVIDELLQAKLQSNYSLSDEADVEWVEHPDWFFKISKFALPYLKGSFVPECHFLKDMEKYPDDLHNFVLKPLFSFSGHGVILDVNETILNKIKDKENFVLQRKIDYSPFIITPDGNAKAEIRVMYVWPENSVRPVAVNNLLRLSKGKMLGVAHNNNHTWVGSSVAFHNKAF
jgi:hypothetical protein